MKKFVLKALFFGVCVVVMDALFGFGFSWLRGHAKGGSTANCEYIANRANDDIIIFGSSRASHHYIPQIIEDSLGVSCYNCGEEGNGVVLAYGRLKMMTNRYKPKLIVFEITPGYDYGIKEPNTKYLGYLRAYYNKSGIEEIFDVFDGEFSRLKMRSKMYQNTGRLLPDIIDNIIYRDNQKGYTPLYGKMNQKSTLDNNVVDKTMEIDSIKLSYVEKVIELALSNDIPIIFTISPRYGLNSRTSNYEPAFSLCKKRGVPVYNFINYPSIADNAVYFQDGDHMNHKGAEAYTNMLVTKVLNKIIHK